MSTTPHKATPEQWSDAGVSASGTRACLLELRARVEALEATQHAHVDLSHLSDAEREAAMNELRAASAEPRPTVKARITRDRDETGDYLIIHDASPPASSLVERVTSAIDNAPWDEGLHQWDEARAAIRELAAWLRDRGGTHWAGVAQRLELEANR